jgi:hypothetical protein
LFGSARRRAARYWRLWSALADFFILLGAAPRKAASRLRSTILTGRAMRPNRRGQVYDLPIMVGAMSGPGVMVSISEDLADVLVRPPDTGDAEKGLAPFS